MIRVFVIGCLVTGGIFGWLITTSILEERRRKRYRQALARESAMLLRRNEVMMDLRRQQLAHEPIEEGIGSPKQSWVN